MAGEHVSGAVVVHGEGLRCRHVAANVVVDALVPLVLSRLLQQGGQPPGGQHDCGGQVDLTITMMMSQSVISNRGCFLKTKISVTKGS